MKAAILTIIFILIPQITLAASATGRVNMEVLPSIKINFDSNTQEMKISSQKNFSKSVTTENGEKITDIIF